MAEEDKQTEEEEAKKSGVDDEYSGPFAKYK